MPITIANFSFTKDWTNPTDFPTIVSGETQVRADMQLLHDEAKAYINNTLLPQLRSSANLAESAIQDIAIGAVTWSEDAAGSSAMVTPTQDTNGNPISQIDFVFKKDPPVQIRVQDGVLQWQTKDEGGNLVWTDLYDFNQLQGDNVPLFE